MLVAEEVDQHLNQFDNREIDYRPAQAVDFSRKSLNYLVLALEVSAEWDSSVLRIDMVGAARIKERMNQVVGLRFGAEAAPSRHRSGSPFRMEVTARFHLLATRQDLRTPVRVSYESDYTTLSSPRSF